MNEPRNETRTTPPEFKDFMQRGDDFYKIELWRPAKAWYKRALEFNIERENVLKKIANCDRLLAFEVKVIWILVAIVITVIVLILLIY